MRKVNIFIITTSMHIVNYNDNNMVKIRSSSYMDSHDVSFVVNFILQRRNQLSAVDNHMSITMTVSANSCMVLYFRREVIQKDL